MAVLGLIFLKHISDAFEEAHAKLEDERDKGADPEYPDEYRFPEHLLGATGGTLAGRRHCRVFEGSWILA